MGPYILRRLIQAAGTLFLLSILFFLLVRFQPGTGPCTGPGLGCEESLHLDQPIANQYVLWLGDLLHGKLGTSAHGTPVDDLIRQELPPTAMLVIISFLVQQLLALPLGMLGALRQYSFVDGALTFGSYVALSLPAFVLGPILLYLFVAHWSLFPPGHPSSDSLPVLGSGAWFAAAWHQPPLVLGDMVRHMLLPAAVLISTGVALDSRFMRAAMLQVLHEDYIRTAKAKGLPRWLVVFKHAFRNALLPIITNIGLYLPAFVTGVVIVEVVFSWGGLGYTFGEAVTGRAPSAVSDVPTYQVGVAQTGTDFPVLQALVMLSAVAVVLANLLADLAYAWLDPRIRFERSDE